MMYYILLRDDLNKILSKRLDILDSLPVHTKLETCKLQNPYHRSQKLH